VTTAAFATGLGPGEATTAAFATGDGPGLATEVTTAALATRDGLSGISGSFCFECHVGFDSGDDGLDGDAAVGDELAAGPTHG
jgi:hypothetical protein